MSGGQQSGYKCAHLPSQRISVIPNRPVISPRLYARAFPLGLGSWRPTNAFFVARFDCGLNAASKGEHTRMRRPFSDHFGLAHVCSCALSCCRLSLRRCFARSFFFLICSGDFFRLRRWEAPWATPLEPIVPCSCEALAQSLPDIAPSCTGVARSDGVALRVLLGVSQASITCARYSTSPFAQVAALLRVWITVSNMTSTEKAAPAVRRWQARKPSVARS